MIILPLGGGCEQPTVRLHKKLHYSMRVFSFIWTICVDRSLRCHRRLPLSSAHLHPALGHSGPAPPGEGCPGRQTACSVHRVCPHCRRAQQSRASPRSIRRTRCCRGRRSRTPPRGHPTSLHILVQLSQHGSEASTGRTPVCTDCIQIQLDIV